MNKLWCGVVWCGVMGRVYQ